MNASDVSPFHPRLARFTQLWHLPWSSVRGFVILGARPAPPNDAAHGVLTIVTFA